MLSLMGYVTKNVDAFNTCSPSPYWLWTGDDSSQKSTCSLFTGIADIAGSTRSLFTWDVVLLFKLIVILTLIVQAARVREAAKTYDLNSVAQVTAEYHFATVEASICLQ